MSTLREKPYDSTEKSFSDLMKVLLYIPIEQRNYEWKEEHITQVFLDDIIPIFEENKYIHCMGNIDIYVNQQKKHSVLEGQQRIITTYLMLVAIGFQYPDISVTLFGLHLFCDPKKGTEAQKRIWDQYGKEKNFKLPKIWCNYEADNQALIDIVNQKVIPITKVDVSQHFTYVQEEKKYKCNLCHVRITDRKNNERHLKDNHKIITKKEYQTNSLLYDAFSVITDLIKELEYDSEKMEELKDFILEDMMFQENLIKDPVYASRKFVHQNDRGKRVGQSDIQKNMILSEIHEERQHEVYKKWIAIKSTPNGEKCMNCAIQLYNNKIQRKTKVEDYKTLLEGELTYSNVHKFFAIVEKIQGLDNEINHDRFGRILTEIKGCDIAWEGYGYALFPIFYTIGRVDKKLLKLFVKWHIRNTPFRESKSLNSLVYSNPLIDISNKVLKNKDYPYYEEIRNVFKKDSSIIQENNSFIQYIVKYPITNESGNLKKPDVLRMLHFYEILKSTDCTNSIFHQTIEHLYPQSKKDELENKHNINLLGNLTLLEGDNSENGHRGNKSLQDKPYREKKESYKQSGFAITRVIVEDYPEDFQEAQILTRTQAMATFLAEKTNIYA